MVGTVPSTGINFEFFTSLCVHGLICHSIGIVTEFHFYNNGLLFSWSSFSFRLVIWVISKILNFAKKGSFGVILNLLEHFLLRFASLLIFIVFLNVINYSTKIDEKTSRDPEPIIDLLSGVHQAVDANTNVSGTSDAKNPPSIRIKSLLPDVGLNCLINCGLFRIVNVSKCHF